MAQYNVTTSGAHLAAALVTPAGGGADVTLASVAEVAAVLATSTAAGRVELATNAETTTGTDATRAVTPAGLFAQSFAAGSHTHPGLIPEGQIVAVDTIAALRALSPGGTNSNILVRGHTTVGDGGAGIFYWAAADNRQMVVSATIANGGTVYFLHSEIWTATGTGTPARWLVSAVSSGVVTGIERLDPGKFTVNPNTSAGATNVAGTGSGCTLNLTMGPLDNGGTIIAPNAGGTGRWIRLYSGAVNVQWFGAKIGAAVDAQPAFQAAIAAFSESMSEHSGQYNYGPVIVPPGRYLIAKPIILQNGTRFSGVAHRTSILVADASLNGPTIRTGPKLTYTQRSAINWTKIKRVRIENFTLTGSCEHAIQLCFNTESEIRDIYVRCNTSSHGLYIEDSFDAEILNVQTFGAGINAASACLYMGRDCNAFNVVKFETSNGSSYGILHNGDPSGTNVAGHAVSYRDLTLQGHTVSAICVKSCGYGGLLIENVYTEGNAQAIELGTFSGEGDKVARGVCINGGLLSGDPAKPAKAVLACYRVDGLSVNGVQFGIGGCQAIIGLGNVMRMSVMGCTPGYTVDWLWNPSTQTSADGKIKALEATVGSPGYRIKPQGFILQDNYGASWKPFGGTMMIMSGNSPLNSESVRLVKLTLDDDVTPPVWVLDKVTLASIPL